VVQLIVADVVVTLPVVTALITGAGGTVAKVKLAEVAVPAESVELTA
jgi:hypothetical protein